MKTMKTCFSLLVILLLGSSAHAGMLIDQVKFTGQNGGALTKQHGVLASKVGSMGDKPYQLSWKMAVPGEVTVHLVDLYGNIVATFHQKEKLEAGEYTVEWDGTDSSGRPCPAGLYLPVIMAVSKEKGAQAYNPTSSPWGEEVVASNVNYDSDRKLLTYTLPQTALVRIRAGEKDGGPFYKTITDWVLRSAGEHSEPWDGLDDTGKFMVAGKDKFNVAIDAFSVPANAIMVQGPASTSLKTKKISSNNGGSGKTFPVFPAHGKRLAYFSVLPHALLPDLGISATPISGDREKKELHALSGEVPFRVSLSQGELADKEKVELYLYVDGKMIHEGLVDSLPAEVIMDNREFSNGKHLVTFNLRTSSYRAASYSMEVFIKN